ncbi:MAG: hypothetical protein QXI42_10075 [Thermoproteota archaeon]
MTKTVTPALLSSVLLLLSPLAVAGDGQSIGLVRLSEEYKTLPVKIYWEDSAECGAEFNNVLKKTLDTSIVLLRKSIYRFMEENDGMFDELVKLRLEYSGDENSYQIYVSGKQLENGIGGVTEIYSTDEGMVRTRIYFDCEVVLKPVAPALNVVLHELLHALGLGHADFNQIGGESEIMAAYKSHGEPTIYASTLDLYALYLLWFKGYDKSRLYLNELPTGYREVKPYLVELEELKKIYEELHEKYGVLSGRLETLETVLDNMEGKVDKIVSDVSRLNTTILNLGKELEKQSKLVKGLETELEEASRNIDSMRSEINSMRATYERHLSDLRLVVLVLTFAVVASIMMHLLRRGGT